jgi:hypothetical protein
MNDDVGEQGAGFMESHLVDPLIADGRVEVV